MEIPIDALMFRVDSAKDFAAVAAKDSSNQGVPQWPDEILHQAQQYVGSDRNFSEHSRQAASTF